MFDLEKKTSDQLSKDIFPTEAWDLISRHKEGDQLVVIDVSTPQEYKHLHLQGAINVNLLSRFFKARLDVMDRRKIYLIYCKAGGRSKIAQKLMLHLGFQTVYNVIGGTFLWEEEGFPFATETDGVNRPSFCPFRISIVAFRRIRKVLQSALSHVGQPKGISTSTGQES